MTTFTANSSLVTSVLASPTGEWYSRAGYSVVGAAIHMAEGGGTDTHLARLDGNSSHYVIKYTGALVQMVPEFYAAGSMNPRLTRTTDGPLYGISVLRAVMGSVSPTYVNRVFIAIEIEGFASTGPNFAQRVTLGNLIRDLASRYASTWRGLIGHADQQSYKACPGPHIPWNQLGGHGLWLPEDDNLPVTNVKAEDWTPGPGHAPERRPVRSTPDRQNDTIVGWVEVDQIVRTIAEATTSDGNVWRLMNFTGSPGWILRSDFLPLVQGGDLAVDALFGAFLARSPLLTGAQCVAQVDEQVTRLEDMVDERVAAEVAVVSVRIRETLMNGARILFPEV